METRAIEEIANAVLYEGYILYPYRASAVKNRKRFNFGVLHPAYTEAQRSLDASIIQTECLVLGSEATVMEVKLRFLQLVARTVNRRSAPALGFPGGKNPEFEPVEKLETGDQVFEAWEEVVEREIEIAGCKLGEVARSPLRHAFDFAPQESVAPVLDDDGQIAGAINRTRYHLEGLVEVSAKRLEGGAFKVLVSVSNRTQPSTTTLGPNRALMQSLISTHTILQVTGGEFISLIDPPDPLRSVVASCRNIGTWPVLIGEEGKRDTMLSSPIILYDYPQVAPESPGDLFDGTEIDEMLALRIMTLTDDEKQEMRHLDPRAREILERTEALPPEQLMKLHGALRWLRPRGKEAG